MGTKKRKCPLGSAWQCPQTLLGVPLDNSEQGCYEAAILGLLSSALVQVEPRGSGQSPSLPPPSSPQLQPAGWQAERLLPKFLHDLPDPGQVGFAQREVAASGPHVVANHAVLCRCREAFCLGRHYVLSRVQEAPVIPVAGCGERTRAAQSGSFQYRHQEWPPCPGGAPRRRAPAPTLQVLNVFWKPSFLIGRYVSAF